MIKPPFKILKSHLVDAFFITAEKLYREFKEPLGMVDRFRSGRIYFLVKRRKARFSSARLSKRCQIVFKYTSQGMLSRPHKVDIAQLIHGAPTINRKYFPTPAHLQSMIEYVDSANEYERLLKRDPLVAAVMPGSGEKERVDRAIAYHFLTPADPLPKDENRHIIFAHQLLRVTDDVPEKYEVMYIGKAMELSDRMHGHKRVQQAQAECEDDAEVYLYFFTPRFEAIESSDGRILKQPSDYLALGEESLVLAAEAGLINHFSPEMNVQNKTTDLRKSKVMARVRSLKYTHFISECNFDEHDYAFETTKISKSGVHEKIYSL
ncbi:hypothetical protein SAMN04490179_1295 [Pseudomonas antarctica]|uniref:GIY-YIG domain-containing protein n=1 Tax=Pseudomonas antarctica TaxID=219572 RepID=A0A1G9WNU2_9PSED|nr:hypothetical protein [Pseudomonas antarctica]KAF2409526.1 hypothetical protein PSAN_19310 [Pseudomonas antarctica]SDM86232.1 hypothetical protein SAMN04490179_1295 [Pseudomonas antarctica]